MLDRTEASSFLKAVRWVHGLYSVRTMASLCETVLCDRSDDGKMMIKVSFDKAEPRI